MPHSSFSQMLRELSEVYYNREIGPQKYRARRREILDAIDQAYNGNATGQENLTRYAIPAVTGEDIEKTVEQSSTDTQPNFVRRIPNKD
ncbi:hypothetical protein [Teredinibacter waterburyi]|jgi:hypothetical protein|uniref:hypothetical protein n=1 Tax=Teredinibacter waterburyi TaxID=1500538 RepID=UPI00165EE48E|nr:hypothetical protein [Teredinibacter waterburyi]